MKRSRLTYGLALLSLLAACASPIPRQDTHTQISRELDAASKAVPPAPAKPDIQQALLPPLLTGQSEAARQALEPRFNLSVSAAPAAQVFLAIASGSRYSLVVHPEVKGEITVDLKNVSAREALDTLRELYGYDYRIDGLRIMVLPNTLQTRLFQVNYLAGKRQGMTEMRVSSTAMASNETGSGTTTSATGGAQGGQRKPDTSRLTTNFENDLWAELKTALTTLVGTADGRSVLVNPISGVIIVRALPAEIRGVEGYLKATQLVVERQVMLEAKILEVLLNDAFQTGINWAQAGRLGDKFVTSSANLGGATFPPNPSNLPLFPSSFADVGALGLAGLTSPIGIAFQTSNFAAILQFLETQGELQVLSSPRIATLNNQKAVLKVGTDEFFVTNVSTTTTVSTATVTTPTLTLEPFFSGITLDVTPQIDAEDNIILHVHPSISDVTEQQKVIKLGAQTGDITLPLASSKVNETDSIVRVSNGNIVAIGGLFTQVQRRKDTGLPGAAGVPGIGDVLGQRSSSLAKGEIVILIKPTIIEDNRGWQAGLDEVRERLHGLTPKPEPEVVPR
jgi:MSHA biogenesis protein MshL